MEILRLPAVRHAACQLPPLRPSLSIWDYNSPAWAGRFLDEWCRRTMRSRIEPFKKIARSLRQHQEFILNYFHAQKLISSGVVEGLNNKAKVAMRKSYGFRTFRVLNSPSTTHLARLPSRH